MVTREWELLDDEVRGGMVSPGDEGSIMAAANKNWVGVLSGGVMYNTEFVLSANDILDDICAATGGGLTCLPRQVGFLY